MIEKELVWEELDLDSLLSYEQSIEKQLDSKLLKNKPEMMKKHHKMLKKPVYVAVMERYKSTPHKPKAVTKTKLSELADPILGKLTHHERQRLEKYHTNVFPHRSKQSNQFSSPERGVRGGGGGARRQRVAGDEGEEEEEEEDEGDEAVDARSQQFLVNYGSPAKHPNPFHQINEIKQLNKLIVSSQLQEELLLSPIVEENTPQSYQSHRKPESNLFLTEMEESGGLSSSHHHQSLQSQQNFIVANIKNNKNSFASIIRSRVQNATKMNKLLQPIDLVEVNHQSPVKGRFEENKHLPQSQQQQQPPLLLPAYPQQLQQQLQQKAVMNPQRKVDLKKKIVMTNQQRNQPLNRRGIKFNAEDQKGNYINKSIYQDPLTKKSKKLKSSGYAVEVKRYSNQPKPLLPNPPKKTKSRPSIFLTGDNESTEDETSVKEQLRNRLRNRLNYNPPKVPSKRGISKERSSSQPPVRENKGRKIEKQEDNRSNAIGRGKSVPNFNRNKSQDGLMKSRESTQTKKSLKANNKQHQQQQQQQSGINRGRNYSIRRSSASVPDLLRQKVIQNREETKNTPSVENMEREVSDPSIIVHTEASVHHIGEGTNIERDDSTADLKAIIDKLQTMEQSKSNSGKFYEPKSKPSGEMIQDKQMTSLLKKHAEKLNQYLSDAQGYLDEYQQLKDQ